MSTFQVFMFLAIAPGTSFEIHHSTTKVETVKLSLFQRIGLLYREIDLISARIPQNPYAAKAYFYSAVQAAGGNLSLAELLLSASNWKLRMDLAWELLTDYECRKTRKIDYDICENYWPTLEFLSRSWSAGRAGRVKTHICSPHDH